MMMFVTLSLILLAFFILLNSMAVIDNEKKKAALGSLLGSFGLMPGASSAEQGDKGTTSQDSIIGGEGMLKMFENTRKAMEMLRASYGFTEKDASIELDEKTGDIKLVLSDQLVFPAGEAVVSFKVFPILDHIAAIAKNSAGEVKVTGHTDNRKTRGGPSNWQLSLERGAIVARHLESIGSLTRGKVSARGMSRYQPREDNKTPAGRRANRRVEIIIKTRKEE